MTKQEDIWQEVTALMEVDRDFTLSDVVHARQGRKYYSEYEIGAALKAILKTGSRDLVRVRRGIYRLPSVSET